MSTVIKISELKFDKNIKAWDRLPEPNTDAMRLIMSENGLKKYQSDHDGNIELIIGNGQFTIKEWSCSISVATKRKSRILQELGTTV